MDNRLSSSTPTTTRPPTTADLNTIRLSQHIVERAMWHPMFPTVATGAFARSRIPRGDGKFGVFEIAGVVELQRPYTFGHTRTAKVFRAFINGNSRREAILRFDSINKLCFTKHEFEAYREEALRTAGTLPSLSDVIRKREQICAMRDHLRQLEVVEPAPNRAPSVPGGGVAPSAVPFPSVPNPPRVPGGVGPSAVPFPFVPNSSRVPGGLVVGPSAVHSFSSIPNTSRVAEGPAKISPAPATSVSNTSSSRSSGTNRGMFIQTFTPVTTDAVVRDPRLRREFPLPTRNPEALKGAKVEKPRAAQITTAFQAAKNVGGDPRVKAAFPEDQPKVKEKPWAAGTSCKEKPWAAGTSCTIPQALLVPPSGSLSVQLSLPVDQQRNKSVETSSTARQPPHIPPSRSPPRAKTPVDERMKKFRGGERVSSRVEPRNEKNRKDGSASDSRGRVDQAEIKAYEEEVKKSGGSLPSVSDIMRKVAEIKTMVKPETKDDSSSRRNKTSSRPTTPSRTPEIAGGGRSERGRAQEPANDGRKRVPTPLRKRIPLDEYRKREEAKRPKRRGDDRR